jgi:hypothetical protein
MKKSELRALIKEMLCEELSTTMILTEGVTRPENLIATHVCNNPEFETACMTGDATKIMSIIDSEMQANNMFTPGAKKFRNDVFYMTRGNARVPKKIGEQILFFAWNCQMSGIGLGVNGATNKRIG